MSSATIALDKFRDAEMKRQARLTDEANSIVHEAMVSLMHRYGFSAFCVIISNNILYNIA